jgi:putative peptidoglycan lipid II flippase
MKSITISFIKILCASLAMGVIAKVSYNALLKNVNANFSLILSIGIGAITYFAIIYFMKIEEVDVIVNAIKRMMIKTTY